MAFHRGPKLVTDGLVLYVDAANPKSYVSGSTTTRSLVGSVSGSLLNGVGFSTGSNGSWVFDGSNDYVDISSNPISSNSSFSISVFIKFTNFNDNSFRPIIDAGNFGSPTANYTLSKNTSNQLYVAANGGYIGINTPIVNNTIYNIVATAQFGNPYVFKMYVNSIEQTIATSGSTNALTINISNVNILKAVRSGTYFGGEVYNCIIYNRALSAAEVLQNYNATKSRFGL